MRFSFTVPKILLVFALSSCMSAPHESYEEEPHWMSEPPNEKGYYYGIGGSHSGDEAEDREIAISRAQSNLAASISVDIVSELELSNTITVEGVSSEALESRIHQSISQSLVNLETVDNWYHPDRGYWILFRMDREEWDNQRQSDRRVSVPVPSGLEENSGYNIPFLAILANLNVTPPLQLLPGGKNTAYEIVLDWVVSDYPQTGETEGIHFSKLTGVVSFRQFGLVLFSREYGPYKKGGLSYEQAREAAAVMVLDDFRKDVSFREEIRRVMP